jgi:N-acetylmuramoyl-L-alanine amidase
VIAIDPGHPSETSAGDVVQNGTTEVHVVWQVSLKLRRLLEQRGYAVVMTKTAERQLVRNRERAEIANRAGAALLVRLHADTGPSRGFALYYPDRKGTVAGVTGPDTSVMRRSREAALALHDGMAETLRGALRDGGVLGDSKTYVGSQQGALTGSIFSTVPAVTVEMVVLADAGDAAFIRSESGQDRMATALAAGIDRYLRGNPARDRARD